MNKETMSYIMLFVIAVSAAILTSSLLTFALVIGIFALVFGIVKVIKYVRGKRGDLSHTRDILCLIASILSIFIVGFWYLALPMAITTLVLSLKRIKESGSVLAKTTTSFSIIGIVNCVFWYVSAIMLIIVTY